MECPSNIWHKIEPVCSAPQTCFPWELHFPPCLLSALNALGPRKLSSWVTSSQEPSLTTQAEVLPSVNPYHVSLYHGLHTIYYSEINLFTCVCIYYLACFAYHYIPSAYNLPYSSCSINICWTSKTPAHPPRLRSQVLPTLAPLSWNQCPFFWVPISLPLPITAIIILYHQYRCVLYVSPATLWPQEGRGDGDFWLLYPHCPDFYLVTRC